jgi:spermidine/putrescine transport system ATP-binding protein
MSDRIAVMQAGHILQIGAPREIYEQPTHRFVADFIGESNFLTGELLTSAQGDLMLRVDGVGDVSLGEAITAPQKSGQVTVSIRPERLSLDPAGESKEGRLEGLVSGVVYIGTDTAYHIELGGGQQSLRVRMQNSGGTADAQTETRNFAKGDPVSVTIPADAARVLVD